MIRTRFRMRFRPIGTWRTAATLAAALLSGLTATAPASGQRAVSERLPAAADGHVRIHNVAGTVKVTGWDRDSIAVTGKVHDTKTERFGIRRSGDGVELGLWDTTVESVLPSHIEVYVPARSRVWIRTGSASVFVADVSGGIDVSSVGGVVEVRGETRDVSVESMTGAVVIDCVTAIARARSVTAPIRIHGQVLDAMGTSVSGNILIENARISRGSFETVDGELRFVGDVIRGSTLTFVTHSGAVEFLLPRQASAGFRLGTFEGSVHNEFGAPIRTVASKIKGSEHTLALGDGGASIHVRTFRGRIVIRSR